MVEICEGNCRRLNALIIRFANANAMRAPSPLVKKNLEKKPPCATGRPSPTTAGIARRRLQRDQKRQLAGTYLNAAAALVQPQTTGAPTASGDAGRPVVALTTPLPGVSRIGTVRAVASWPA